MTHLRSSALGASLPEFEKCAPSHLVFKETHFPATCDRMVRQSEDVMLIGLIRDPVDALTSWWNVANEFPDGWAIEHEWLSAHSKNRGRSGHVAGFIGWVTVARTLLNLAADEPQRVKLVTYEALRADPIQSVLSLFAAIDLEMPKQLFNFIASSTSKSDSNPYGVYRADRPVRPRGDLPAWIADEIRSRTRDAGLHRFLRTRSDDAASDHTR